MKKVEITLPEDIYRFINVKAIYNDKTINEELTDFITKNVKELLDQTFLDAISY